MSGPDDELARQLERSRRERLRKRRAPLRIIIASDPSKPVRTIVLPRRLPIVVVIAVLLVGGVAVVASLTSLRLGGLVSELRRRVGAMVHAAADLADRPTPTATGASLGPAVGGVHKLAGEVRRFVIESVNSGESIEVAIDLATGEVEGESYRKLRHLMRCRRTGAETPIDPRLVEMLYRISERTGQRIGLVSGFRAPMYSTADLSYHTRGMAADVRIAGMTPLMVRDLVTALGARGVGYYPVSQFVHVDVRDERYAWTDYGHDRGDDEGSAHGSDPALAGSPPP